MSESSVIRFIRIVLLLIALAVAIWFVVWLFSPNNNSEPTETTTTTAEVEAPFNSVQFVQEGEVTAPEDHYSVIITISASSRTVSVYNAYNASPATTKSYANSQASYDTLYAALESVGFFATKDNKEGYDRAGYCPLGIKYDYRAGNDINFPDYSSWSASCSAKAGTYGGNKSQTKTLFINQIPDYEDVTKDVTL